MALEWEQVVVDARDPAALGRWWQEALGWVAVNPDPEEYEIRPAPDRLPGLLFVPVPEDKTVKNRLHLDLHVGEDRIRPEVERLVALGAVEGREWREVGGHWIAMTDPEGNEFDVE